MAPAGERPAAFAPAVAAPVATHAHRHGASQESAHAMPRAAAQPRVRTAQVPLVFEADSLSSSQESRFIARTPRYAVRVSSSGAEIALRPGSPAHAAEPITMRFAGASPGIRRVETDRAGGTVSYFHGNDPRRGGPASRPSAASASRTSIRASTSRTTARTARSSTTSSSRLARTRVTSRSRSTGPAPCAWLPMAA